MTLRLFLFSFFTNLRSLLLSSSTFCSASTSYTHAWTHMHGHTHAQTHMHGHTCMSQPFPVLFRQHISHTTCTVQCMVASKTLQLCTSNCTSLSPPHSYSSHSHSYPSPLTPTPHTLTPHPIPHPSLPPPTPLTSEVVCSFCCSCAICPFRCCCVYWGGGGKHSHHTSSSTPHPRPSYTGTLSLLNSAAAWHRPG